MVVLSSTAPSSSREYLEATNVLPTLEAGFDYRALNWAEEQLVKAA